VQSSPSLHTVTQFAKFYGAPDDNQAVGILGSSRTWAQIVADYEDYLKKNGLEMLDFHEHSSIDLDGKLTMNGFASVGEGKEKLLQYFPGRYRNEMDESAYRPFGLIDQCKSLNCWRWVRKALGLDGTTELPKLWLSLSNLFSILFPEETDLYENAHHADADTEMTRLLLHLFARAWLNEPLDDKSKNTIWNPAWSRKHTLTSSWTRMRTKRA
jgi:hypothetical protein